MKLRFTPTLRVGVTNQWNDILRLQIAPFYDLRQLVERSI